MLADTNAVHFRSGDRTLVGTYYLADTDQPAPFALLLHGIPGSEKNYDIAQALREAGWHVLVPHFSGAWGSDGPYNIHTQADDAHAALQFALNYERPVRLDQLAVVGFSMGSRAALKFAVEEPRVGAIVSLVGFADFTDSMFPTEWFESLTPFLKGSTGQEMAAQYAKLAEGQQPYEMAKALAPRPVLAVHGTSDEVVPYFHLNMFSAPHIQQLTIPNANHTLAAHRRELVAGVFDFLTGWIA